MNPTPRVPTSPLPQPVRASLQDEDRVVLLFADSLPFTPTESMFRFSPEVSLNRVIRDGRRRITLLGGPFDMRAELALTIDGFYKLPVLPDGILDRYRTNETLGFAWREDHAVVRLFHPRARAVELIVFDDPAGEPVAEHTMKLDDTTGCWSVETNEVHAGQVYGYRVDGPDDVEEQQDTVFCDPYSWMVAKSPGWPVKMRSLVPARELLELPPLGHVSIPPRDLMIYEAHVKDVTARAPELDEHLRGTYAGVADGLFPTYVRELGMNAVEWLPLHVYDYREPPFGTPGNAWNETALNHWGYMSVQFFAPEPRYQQPTHDGGWIGTDPAIVHHLRRMVQSLHDKGLAVIVDVVYNHVGNYGLSPLRRLDPKYWLRHDGHGQLKSESGCGNDFRTERPMARRMIVDSLLHWSRCYGIDGFRFDLAGLIDDGTLDEISNRLREEHPAVHLIAEPWGGLYDKRRFAIRGWSSWNDKYRDGIRGHEAGRQHGLLLGGHNGDLLHHCGGQVTQVGGPFEHEWQSVNYLASHDYYNFGDFLRIARGLVKPGQQLDPDNPPELTPDILKRARLGFFLLFTSRGMLLLHQGDEWLRAKIVDGQDNSEFRGKPKPRKLPGQLDRDSYNRDDATNWIEWNRELNPPEQALREYVRGMASLRHTHPALRIARYSNTHRLPGHGERQLAYVTRVPGDRLVILANLDEHKTARVQLPEGPWVLLANEDKVVENVRKGFAHDGCESLPPLSARLFMPRDRAVQS